jgi:alpha-galactosidase
MGYNTWNDYRCNISADDIMLAAKSIVDQGLNKLGYVYVNMDDCWAQGRNSTKVVYPDPTTFPNGIKPVADYVHSLGLKFGIYTDRGTQTCAGRPGSLNYEAIDAQTYASWGVDYLKEDSCSASQDHNTAFQEYGKMRDALNATGRPIYFSLCGWNSWYAPVGSTLGNSWRIAGDCNSWGDVLNAIDTNANLAKYASPGSWNDPDMLLGSSNMTAAYLAQIQSRTMFSMWCVMAAPLLIGSNIINLPPFDIETYSNTELIAVDQDSLGLQGVRVLGGPLTGSNPSLVNIWAKPLSGDLGVAAVFLNNGPDSADITCDQDCFKSMGFSTEDVIQVRDLWAHANIGTVDNLSYSITVPGGGASFSLRF